MSRPDGGSMDKTGGPAFPYAYRLPSGNIDTLKQYSGLSMRDYFAGMALQGWLANPNFKRSVEEYAIDAYKYADALLTQRGTT